jgi:hypothetical protein
MSGTLASGARAAGGAPPRRALFAALLAVGAATAAAGLLWAHPAASAAPVLLAAAAWAAWTAPLRASAGLLVFALLAVDDSLNANGLWHTPLAVVGDLLRHSLRTVVAAAEGIWFTGAELAVLFLLGVAAWRAARRERAARQVDVPVVVTGVALAYVAAVALAIANGVGRGGSLEVAVWQTRPLFLTAALYLLFAAAFRGPADHVALGRIVVLAAVVRAALALWVRHAVAPGASVPVGYVTDHGDSILFSLACAILVARLLERPDAARVRVTAAVLPLLLLGIHANGRRTAWLQLALSLGVFFVVARGARWKRPVARAALLAAPLVLLYGAAGWSSSAAAFAPVQLVRSVVDARVDRSTWNRHVENWNLAMSMRDHPLAGRGFGREWTEFYRGDDISTIFYRYRAQPHNQLLGLLLFAGPFAFVGIWAPFALLVFLGARAYPRARTPEDRAAALCIAACAVVMAVQCFADLGPFWHQYWVLTALALAMGGKLARATGALR